MCGHGMRGLCVLQDRFCRKHTGDNLMATTIRETGQRLGLSTPSLLTFLLSFVIAMAVLFAKFFGATIPGLTGETTQFAGLLVAYVLLSLGCLMRSL